MGATWDSKGTGGPAGLATWAEGVGEGRGSSGWSPLFLLILSLGGALRPPRSFGSQVAVRIPVPYCKGILFGPGVVPGQ